MKEYRRILFLGFRCVGKSSISKELSKIMKMKVFDMDVEIEKEQRRTINEITDGGRVWEDFRKLELEKLKRLLSINNIIISAGGGTGVNGVNFNDKITFGELQKQEILASADTLKILLWADEGVVEYRLKESKKTENTRPDLDGKTETLDEYIKNNIKVMKQRENIYKEMVDISFNTNISNKRKNAEGLLKIINENYKLIL